MQNEDDACLEAVIAAIKKIDKRELNYRVCVGGLFDMAKFGFNVLMLIVVIPVLAPFALIGLLAAWAIDRIKIDEQESSKNEQQ